MVASTAVKLMRIVTKINMTLVIIAAGLLALDYSVLRLTVTELGQPGVLAVAACMAVVTLLLLGAMSLLVKRLVITRLQAIRLHYRSVESSSSPSQFPEDGRGDELSELAAILERTTIQLIALREQQREGDVRVDATDNAAGLLQNIRNGVAPIGVIAGNLLALDEAGWIESARKAIGELKRPDLEPARVAKLTGFLAKAAERLLAQADNRKMDLQKIQMLVGELNNILRGRDVTVRYDPGAGTVSLDRALELSALIVHNRPGHTITCAVPARIPPVTGNQLAVNQIFGIIFLNAAEAIEANQVRGLITVAVETVIENRAPALDVAITDNGEGVSTDRLAEIFERGSSSRGARASGGFGLHWCAATVARMGGRMYADSLGAGLGTTIHVVLPRAEYEESPSGLRPLAVAA